MSRGINWGPDEERDLTVLAEAVGRAAAQSAATACDALARLRGIAQVSRERQKNVLADHEVMEWCAARQQALESLKALTDLDPRQGEPNPPRRPLIGRARVGPTD